VTDGLHSKRDGIRNATCCPTIVVATTGTLVKVMAVVMADKVIVQRLTDFIYTGSQRDGDDSCVNVAKLFHVLGRCISNLFQYYAEVSQSTLERHSETSRFFPSVTSYGDSPRDFCYLRHLEKDSSCVTFLAQETDEQKKLIVVKFVQRYGHGAHECLAAAGFAPEIYYFGRVSQAPSYRGYQMVVMEWIEGKSAVDLAVKQKLPATSIDQVREAVKCLHDSQFVFGDLRCQNIMVCLTL
jgi:hypothetical protein